MASQKQLAAAVALVRPAGSCGTTLAIPHPHEDGGGGVVVGGGGDGDAGLAVVLLLCWQHAV